MYGRRYRRRRGYKRRYRRRRSVVSRRRSRGVKVPGLVSPDYVLVKVRYHQVWAVAAATSYIDYVWRGNSVYDPYYAVGGDQPTGVDQWEAFYEKYKVFGSKIHASFINTDESTSKAPVRMTLIPTTNTGFAPTSYDVSEIRGARTKLVNASGNGAGNRTGVTSYNTGRAPLGLSKVQFKTDPSRS